MRGFWWNDRTGAAAKTWSAGKANQAITINKTSLLCMPWSIQGKPEDSATEDWHFAWVPGTGGDGAYLYLISESNTFKVTSRILHDTTFTSMATYAAVNVGEVYWWYVLIGPSSTSGADRLFCGTIPDTNLSSGSQIGDTEYYPGTWSTLDVNGWDVDQLYVYAQTGNLGNNVTFNCGDMLMYKDIASISFTKGDAFGFLELKTKAINVTPVIRVRHNEWV